MRPDPADLASSLARPLPLAAIGFLAGIAIASGDGFDRWRGGVATLATMVACVGFRGILFRGGGVPPLSSRARTCPESGGTPLPRKSSHALLLVLAAFAAGAARIAALPRPIELEDEGRPRLVRVEGRVAEALLDLPPVLRRERSIARFTLDRASADFGAGRMSFPGRVQVDAPLQDRLLARGATVRLVGRVRPARPPRNPGDDDDRARRQRSGIVLAVAIESTAAVEVLSSGRSPFGVLDGVRGRLVRFLATMLPAREAGMAAALLLGVRDGLDPEFLARVAGSGTIHVLAISGAHVALLLIAVRGLLGLLLAPSRADLAALAVAWSYAELAGAEAPVLRAAVACALALTGALIGRPPRPLDALALAAIVLAALDPGDLRRPGFQLSFVACFALLTRARGVFGRRRSRVARAFEPARDAFLISLRCSIFTAPLVLHHFGYAAPLGPLLTLLVTPPFLLAFFLTSILALFGLLLPAAVAAACASPIEPLATLSLRCLAIAFESTAALPFAQLSLPRISAIGAGATLSALVCAGRRPRLCASLAAAALLVEVARTRPPDHVEFWLFDVGHGQSALLRLPDGRDVLFDCGSTAGERFAARTTSLALDALGAGRVDLVVVTHGDADHVNGLPALVREGRIEAIVHGPSFTGAAARETLRLAAAAGLPVSTVTRGAVLVDDPAAGLRIAIVAPDAASGFATENDASLIAAIHVGNRTLLLPGDVQSEGIEALLELEPSLRADVVVLPHHGHDDPMLGPLLHRSRSGSGAPVWLVSRGPESGRETAPRLAARMGADYLTTARRGAIRVRFRAGEDMWGVETTTFVP